MAEGWIRYYAGDEANVYSAGIEANGLNTYAVKVMEDALIDSFLDPGRRGKHAWRDFGGVYHRHYP